MKLVPIALLAAAGLAAAAFAGVFQPSGARGQSTDNASPGGITVVGTGSVSVVPDRAGFTFGMVGEARTAAAALTTSADSVKRVIGALRQAGVARADIQTSEVSLSPRMDENGSVVVGYTATNSVSVTLRRLASAGDVVDAAVGAGANQVYGPNLLAADQKTAYANAMKEAVAEARSKAQTLASSAGTSLGRVTAINEGGGAPQPVFSATAAKDSAVPIEPGTQEIQASVSVTFAIG